MPSPDVLTFTVEPRSKLSESALMPTPSVFTSSVAPDFTVRLAAVSVVATDTEPSPAMVMLPFSALSMLSVTVLPASADITNDCASSSNASVASGIFARKL